LIDLRVYDCPDLTRRELKAGKLSIELR
jgi:hypothetical protein